MRTTYVVFIGVLFIQNSLISFGKFSSCENQRVAELTSNIRIATIENGLEQPTALKSNDRDISMIKFKFLCENGSSDECVLNFVETASSSYEWMYDALKMESIIGTAAECALMSSDNVELSIDSRPFPESTMNIPVYAEMPIPGNYTFQITEIQNLPFGYCARIHDLTEGTYIPLSLNESFSIFQADSFSGIRFEIEFIPQIDVLVMNPNCLNPVYGSIQLAALGDWTASLLDDAGNNMLFSENEFGFSSLIPGDYFLSMENSNEHCAAQSANFTIDFVAPMNAQILTSEVDHCNQGESGVVEISVENAGQYNFVMTNTIGDELFNEMTTEQNILIGDLAGDIYGIDVLSDCGSQSLVIDLRDPQAVSVEILQSDLYIQLFDGAVQEMTVEQESIHASSVHWTLSNGESQSDDLFTYGFSVPGEYNLVCTAQNDLCTDSDSIQIEVESIVGVNAFKMELPINAIVTGESILFVINTSSSERASLSLYDMSGRIIWCMTASMQRGRTIETATGFLPQGKYLIKAVLGDQEVLSRKVMMK